MKIDKEELLRTLETVQYGVAQKAETVQQSRAFAFQDGGVTAFNDDVLCHAPVKGLPKSLHGAVEAKRLLGLLRKIPDKEMNLESNNGTLVFLGKKKRAEFNLDHEILLPVDQVEKASSWKNLDPAFCEAIGIVQECAHEKDSSFCRTVVHITPKWVEAYGNFHAARYRLPTGFEAPSTLCRKEFIRHIASLAMEEFAESEAWVHFKSARGLVYSCRKFLDDQYPDLGRHMKSRGEKVRLPEKLAEVVERANEAASELGDKGAYVTVEVKPGRIRILGKGITCKYEEEVGASDYEGKNYQFLVSPSLLSQFVTKYKNSEVTTELSEDALIVLGDSWKYVIQLTRPDRVEELPVSEEGVDEGGDGGEQSEYEEEQE